MINILEVADEIQIHPSSLSEILDLLFSVGLDRGQVTTLMGNLPQGQRSERLEDGEGQTPITHSQPQIQSDQSEREREQVYHILWQPWDQIDNSEIQLLQDLIL